MPSRRKFIRNASIASALTLSKAGFGFSIPSSPPKPEDRVIGHGNHQYKVDKNWAQINKVATPILNCHEMVQDQHGRLIMLGDHPRSNILIFDKSGKLLDSWGMGYGGAHGLTLSHEGADDFLLITDCGYFRDRQGQSGKQEGQVIKTHIDGRVIFAIGHPRTIGIYKDGEPFMPTETAVAPNGDIYVADGYGSDYIIQYDQNGRYIRHFGGHHNANKEHNLYNAHGVAVDLRDQNNPLLACTSREENCFKLFTLDGRYIRRIDMPGMYVCRAVFSGTALYAGVCWSKDAAGNRQSDSGFVTILDPDYKVISNPGGEAPVYENGLLQPVLQLAQPVFNHGHDVCVDDEENLYVCQWNANQTAPIKLTRI